MKNRKHENCKLCSIFYEDVRKSLRAFREFIANKKSSISIEAPAKKY
jgi:hypothetical protein